MSEENKAVLRRFYDEFFNEGNLDVADEIIAPDCPSTSAACSWGLVLMLSSKPAP
jgi:hypothetical protein